MIRRSKEGQGIKGYKCKGKVHSFGDDGGWKGEENSQMPDLSRNFRKFCVGLPPTHPFVGGGGNLRVGKGRFRRAEELLPVVVGAA